jgi:[ribosomal protein S18]-alanine N-acetyltransferase
LTLDNPTLNVRLANIDDIPAMIDLERQCQTAAHWTEGQYSSALPACGAALTSRLVLIVDNEEQAIDDEERALANAGSRRKTTLAGFLVARHQGHEWELENIVVAAVSRRNRLGTRLLEELLKRACAVGSECIFLEVRESNHSARAFYEKWGFEEIGRRKGYYTSPPEDAVLYRRILRQKRSQKKTVAP